MTDDEKFMKAALDEALKAFDEDEIPVGAVIVVNGKIVARAHNMTERLNDVTSHAEMQALTIASSQGGKYLPQATLYVTLEPCVMCAGALSWAQIGRIVYGAKDIKRGFQKFENCVLSQNLSLLHPKTKVVSGVLEDECADLLKSFFAKKR
ncbi:MAG: nucleoside deaminase [Bacteroidales bacterium]|jgi:tRNA(adenine34) deaminase|nr:nucleoside deaminase [Bacteroidales bacterium]MCR4559942.1 nucleoside deaminase [Bacteroidales bacterium]